MISFCVRGFVDRERRARANPIQESTIRENTTTASSWTETLTKELKAVNINLANVDIGGDKEDDG